MWLQADLEDLRRQQLSSFAYSDASLPYSALQPPSAMGGGPSGSQLYAPSHAASGYPSSFVNPSNMGPVATVHVSGVLPASRGHEEGTSQGDDPMATG